MSRPTRVAIFGAGPSGLFLADSLLKAHPGPLSIDIIDRLPAPYGLVRYGVAPDHPKIKSVINTFAKTFADERVRFLGNVAYGVDLTLEDVQRHYDVGVYAVGAAVDRALGIPGEDLRGNFSSTEFVAWYSGHPDQHGRTISLDAEAVAVIGVGNVAIDVTRILAKHVDELRTTDVPEHVLDALAVSRVRDIYLIGRRGPAQAKFTTPELRELGEIPNADVIVDPKQLELDEASAKVVAAKSALQRNVDVLRDFAARKPEGRARRIHLVFLASPVEIKGTDRVREIVLERNRLDERENAVGTGAYDNIAVEMVFRAVGYRGIPIPGLPFDARAHVVRNESGRIVDENGARLAGQYVAGWIKRGPTGVIGTNKADASETAKAILEDLPSLPPAPEGTEAAVDALLQSRGVRVCLWEDWLAIDRYERELGQQAGREERVKVTDFGALLAGNK
ncbi:MAG: NADP oxidoreductase [Candidatus Eremiobacteraeota bacterium]|nr:NADP oxidoreductase [Candidatus Eremiobacteraeota bacterium]